MTEEGRLQKIFDERSLEVNPAYYDRSTYREGGPYEILFGLDEPISQTWVPQRQIRISRNEPVKDGPGVLAHEIAHSRLLSPEGFSRQDSDEDRCEWYAQRELEAVVYTISKGQPTPKAFVEFSLEEASNIFGDGSSHWGKIIARKLIDRLYKRGFLTKKERTRGMRRFRG